MVAEHWWNLEEVLKCLQQNGLQVKPAKYRFMESSVEYLGHHIDASGVHTTTQQGQTILKAPVLQNTVVTILCSFALLELWKE